MRVLNSLSNLPNIRWVIHTDEDNIGRETIHMVATGRGLLSAVLGTEETRFRLFESAIRWNRVIVAYEDSVPVGFVAFQIYGSGPYMPSLKRFCGEFGNVSGLWRFCVFWIIECRSLVTPFYLYGLKVNVSSRRKGIGSALIQMAEEEAIRRRINNVVLEVSSVNDAAKNMYERCGYSLKKRINLQWASPFVSIPGIFVLQKKLNLKSS